MRLYSVGEIGRRYGVPSSFVRRAVDRLGVVTYRIGLREIRVISEDALPAIEPELAKYRGRKRPAASDRQIPLFH